jgi:hypothetical protein
VRENISWEGHLAGFITGFLLALMIRVKLPVEKKYEWEREDYNEEDDPFLRHFDENGNFIETTEDPSEHIQIKYHYKKDNGSDT